GRGRRAGRLGLAAAHGRVIDVPRRLTTLFSTQRRRSLRAVRHRDGAFQPCPRSYWRLHKSRKERYRLSFFDETDEPQAPPRTTPRTPPRRRRSSGTGRRPPSDQQSIQARRAVAVVAVLIVIILIALLVHGCQVSARNNSLRSYTSNVNSVNQQSAETGQSLFRVLSSGGG